MRERQYTPAEYGFSDLPHDLRFAFLDTISSVTAGNVGFSYHGNAIHLQIPRGAFSALCQVGKRFGLCLDSLYYFPLGSDNPPEIMRHDGNYPGSRGFWLYMVLYPHSGKLAQ